MKNSKEVLRLSMKYEAVGLKAETSLKALNAMTISEALKNVSEIISRSESDSTYSITTDLENLREEVEKFLTEFTINADNSKITHRLMNTVRDVIELYK